MPGKHSSTRNREIRQEALREQLAEQCRFQHILENIKKIENLDVDEENAALKLQAIKAANEQRIRLLGKYLPDLKAVEADIGIGGSLTITWSDDASPDTV